MRRCSNARRKMARSILASEETAQARVQAAKWLSRLLELPLTLEENFFSFLGWCVGDLHSVAKYLQEKMAEQATKLDKGSHRMGFLAAKS